MFLYILGHKTRMRCVDARPRSGQKIAVMGLRSTTRHGNAPAHVGPIEGPFQLVGALGVVRVELRVLSLSVEEGRSTFGVMVGIWAKGK